MNNNYKIFGLITSLLRSDNPPKITKNFSEHVMTKISSNKISSYTNYNNYLNIAASVFFAVITAYSLISYDRLETNVVSVDKIQDTVDNNGLIRRVIDDSDCDYDKKNNEENNESCK
ncbi:hypothetical protein OAM25_01495 [Gammaproteobacteria bacterium]|nr:hypothetical protein [Gammaproteobacteria bacterium]